MLVVGACLFVPVVGVVAWRFVERPNAALAQNGNLLKSVQKSSPNEKLPVSKKKPSPEKGGPATKPAPKEKDTPLKPVLKEKAPDPADPLPADAPGIGPALGAWALALKDAKGREFTATLVFIGRDGSRTFGYLDWQPGEGKTAVEMVCATVDPASRAVRITSRELQTSVPSLTPGVFAAILSPEGRQMSRFSNLRNAGAPAAILGRERRQCAAVARGAGGAARRGRRGAVTWPVE